MDAATGDRYYQNADVTPGGVGSREWTWWEKWVCFQCSPDVEKNARETVYANLAFQVRIHFPRMRVRSSTLKPHLHGPLP